MGAGTAAGRGLAEVVGAEGVEVIERLLKSVKLEVGDRDVEVLTMAMLSKSSSGVSTSSTALDLLGPFDLACLDLGLEIGGGCQS